MRDYGKVSPQFWIGKTGKALRRQGPHTQLVALYLMTCPHANMLGLYYVPKMYIAHETGLGLEAAERGLAGCVEAGFCEYDEASEMVWVGEMAKYQIAETLKEKDLRCKGVQNEYDSLPENPYLDTFRDRYGAAFCMTPPPKSTASSEAPLQPLASQEQEQEHEQEQEQELDQKRDSAPAAPKKSRAPSKTCLPADFAISERVRNWAAQKGHGNLDLHLENFVSAAKRRGYTYADWDEALMEAIRKDWAKLGHGSQNAGPAMLGKAGQATALNAQRWLEETDAIH